MSDNQNIKPSIYDYLKTQIERGVIDFSLRANVRDGDVCFYIHPSDKDGLTADYIVLESSDSVLPSPFVQLQGEIKHPPDGISRRCCINLMSIGERTIRNAKLAVERIGACEKLTKAINLLSEAQELVADVVDGRQ